MKTVKETPKPIHAVSGSGNWKMDCVDYAEARRECPEAVVHCYDSICNIYLCSYQNGHLFYAE